MLPSARISLFHGNGNALAIGKLVDVNATVVSVVREIGANAAHRLYGFAVFVLIGNGVRVQGNVRSAFRRNRESFAVAERFCNSDPAVRRAAPEKRVERSHTRIGERAHAVVAVIDHDFVAVFKIIRLFPVAVVNRINARRALAHARGKIDFFALFAVNRAAFHFAFDRIRRTLLGEVGNGDFDITDPNRPQDRAVFPFDVCYASPCAVFFPIPPAHLLIAFQPQIGKRVPARLVERYLGVIAVPIGIERGVRVTQIAVKANGDFLAVVDLPNGIERRIRRHRAAVLYPYAVGVLPAVEQIAHTHRRVFGIGKRRVRFVELFCKFLSVLIVIRNRIIMRFPHDKRLALAVCHVVRRERTRNREILLRCKRFVDFRKQIGSVHVIECHRPVFSIGQR